MAKIKHRHERGFTIINNTIYEDTRLKLADIGLFDFLYHFPEDWNFNEVDLAKRTSSGRTALRTSLKHLEKFGYVKREWVRNSQGQLVGTNWILDDEGKLANNFHAKNAHRKSENSSSNNSTTDNDVQKLLSETPTSEKQLLVTQMSDSNLLQSTDNTKDLVSSSKPGPAENSKTVQTNLETKNESEHSLDDPKHVSKAYRYWNNCWGKPTAFEKHQITKWVNDFGIEIVLNAFDYAGWYAQKPGPYLKKLFDNYKKQGVKTIDDVLCADKEHAKQLNRMTTKNSKTRHFAQNQVSTSSTVIRQGTPSQVVEALKKAQITLSDKQVNRLNKMINALGVDLVCYAIRLATVETNQSVPSYGFLRSILERFTREGISSVAEAKAKYQAKHQQNKSYGGKSKPRLKEPVPKWMQGDESEKQNIKKSSPSEVARLRETIKNFYAKQ